VDLPAEPAALLAMASLAGLDLERSAQLAVSGAVVAQGTVLCPMSAAARGSTSRRPPTNMSGMVGTSMWCGRREILLASSRAAAF